jgi:hypothetical protein
VLNATPAAQYPESGLADIYAANLLDPNRDPQRTVHQRQRGYTLNPADGSTTPSGMSIFPYPLNRDIAPSLYSYYTWRDTGLETRAGPNGEGADPSVLQFLDEGAPVYSRDEVRSVALPLLMEFRCYPDGTALGANRFDVALAVTLSTTPAFRAFSAGGIAEGGQVVYVDPDLQIQANGGFDPSSLPNPGAETPGKDDAFYFGAVDFVTRVSRSYSVWYEAVDPAGEPFLGAQYHDVIVGPGPEAQPIGTELQLAFRGALAIDPGSVGDEARTDAMTFDAYGDHYASDVEIMDSGNANTGIHFLDADDSWHDDIRELNGARYYQVRVTFLSNPATGSRPVLSGLGVSWSD